jgi:hypothetical protein
MMLPVCAGAGVASAVVRQTNMIIEGVRMLSQDPAPEASN